MNFSQLLAATRKDKPLFQGRLLTFDPGETTGVAQFDCEGGSVKLTWYDQLASTPIEDGMIRLQQCVIDHKPNMVVYEDYRVYAWKTQQHTWASLHTPQLIGALRLIVRQRKLPVHTQMAQVAKQFCTDDKLQEWGWYLKGKKHARDAVRHGAYFLLFNFNPKNHQKTEI